MPNDRQENLFTTEDTDPPKGEERKALFSDNIQRPNDPTPQRGFSVYSVLKSEHE
jgi:hypothetical protein